MLLKTAKFPLYQIRGYQSLFTQGDYVCIQTAKNRWVLDYKHKTDTYSNRRVALLKDPFRPYKLYPLNKRVDNVIQIHRSKSKMFIDEEGQLHSYKPTTFYTIHKAPILARWYTIRGNVAYVCAGTSRTFIYPPVDIYPNYVEYVVIDRKVLLYDLVEEPSDKSRIKL